MYYDIIFMADSFLSNLQNQTHREFQELIYIYIYIHYLRLELDIDYLIYVYNSNNNVIKLEWKRDNK